MDASPNLGLLHFLNEIPDPRGRNGRQHPLSAVLALACCAILCGARSYAAIAQWAHDHDIELMHRLGFTRRPPKSGGIRKVLMAVGPGRPGGRLDPMGRGPAGPTAPRPMRAAPTPSPWTARSARGSFDGLNKAVHLLSLVAHRSGLTVAQAEVPSGGLDKTNEHKAALRLLSGLVLEGRLITGDAIFCQRDLSRQVLDGGGHYLWVVKDNQPTLLADIQAALAPAADGAFSPSAAADLA